MKRVLLALALLGLVAGAGAVPSDLAGGVLITHTPAGHVFSEGFDYCGAYDQYGIASCEEQNTNMVSGGAAQHMFFYIVAAFAEDKIMCGAQFGIGDVTGSDDYFYFVAGSDANICLPNALSTISGASFPAENQGIAIVATDTQWSGNFFPVYWVECYSYYAGGDYNVPLGLYPSDPPLAVFGNCDVPSVIWDIVDLGAMGIGADPGMAVCPAATEFFACCFTDGTCQDLTAYDCEVAGGVVYPDLCDVTMCPQPPEPGACCIPETGECFDLFEEECALINGDWNAETDCASFDCPQPPVWACCIGFDCFELSEYECTEQQGTWYDGVLCDEEPCPVPADDNSWGSIKALYK